MFRTVCLVVVLIASCYSQPRFGQLFGKALKNGIQIGRSAPIHFFPIRTPFSSQSRLIGEHKVLPLMKMESYQPQPVVLAKIAEANVETSTDMYTSMYNELAKQHGMSTVAPLTDIDLKRQMLIELRTVEKVWPPMNSISQAALTSIDENDNSYLEEPLRKDTVVLGGTFDRLHDGHKALLTEAVRRANRRVLVGITDNHMIENKLLHELIEPIEIRKKNVLDFLNSIDSSLTYEVSVIHDQLGQTKTDPDLDIIVVSKETLKGAKEVNEFRRANNLPPLQIDCIDEVQNEVKKPNQDTKISSSDLRKEALGTRLREPSLNRPYFPSYPYVIGLTGGIVSGKTSMAKHFKKLGAAIIDCDELASEIYRPGTECHANLVSRLGANILDENNQIDQIKLEQVFSADKTKINEFNDILWPKLKLELQKRIEQIRCDKTHDVVMIESSALLQAGWQRKVHEVWSVIIPKKIAFQRLLFRDNLDFEEVHRRLAPQPSNDALVKESTVVLSTEWSYLFSYDQAEKAWNGLKEHLKTLQSQP